MQTEPKSVEEEAAKLLAELDKFLVLLAGKKDWEAELTQWEFGDGTPAATRVKRLKAQMRQLARATTSTMPADLLAMIEE